ncbi:Alkaline phosphatase [Halioglobus japonicus]|nr:Alkaline phosphatase [Halioglobus japonicus]
MTSRTSLLLASLLLCSATTLAQPSTQQPEPHAVQIEQPRQVILIIGDGMDEQQITIARNYLRGAAGQLLLDSMPMRAAVQIQTSEEAVDGKPVYVADSANTASTMATGTVTSIGRISTAAGTDQDLTTIAELASAAGMRTGIVTTASVTDATPAAFATHISLRLCEDAATMEDIRYRDIFLGECKSDLKANGGKGSIAEQLAESDVDVILGGGSAHFTPTVEGDSVSTLDLARRNGYEVVSNATELAQASTDKKLLGLFSPGTMPVRLQGEAGREAEAPEPSWLNQLHPYLGSSNLPEPMTCEPNPQFSSVPTLRQMTDAALQHLADANNRGFFLMIESASIDKQSHERKPCGSIGEVEQLEEALDSALAFARTHPHTLIIVTADHAQAAQLIPDESLFAAFPIPVYTPGKLARVITPEGGQMAVNYATNNFFMEEHTGAAVPLFSNSEGVGRIPAFIQQTQIFEITRDYLGI